MRVCCWLRWLSRCVWPAALCRRLPSLPACPACPQILETKIGKLEQLVRLKDAKIQALLARLQAAAQADDPAAAATMGTPASVCSG